MTTIFLTVAGVVIALGLVAQCLTLHLRNHVLRRDMDTLKDDLGADCPHTWGPWELVEKVKLLNEERDAAVARLFIQKRQCHICGYVHYDRQKSTTKEPT